MKLIVELVEMVDEINLVLLWCIIVVNCFLCNLVKYLLDL